MIRRVRAELAYWRAVLAEKSYLIRPYDQVADRRRWVWQRPAPCGRYRAEAMIAALRDGAALREQRIERDDTGPGRPDVSSSFYPCGECGTWLTTSVQGATLPLECEPPVDRGDETSTIAITLQAHFPERCRAARDREVAW